MLSGDTDALRLLRMNLLYLRTEKVLLHNVCHVCTEAQNGQYQHWLLQGAFAFFMFQVATTGKRETWGVQSVAICDLTNRNTLNTGHWT